MNAKQYFLFIALALLACVNQATAQSLTTLHSFTGGSDGANPWVGLIVSSNTLYGTAADGGTNGFGTVFSVNTNGTSFATLHNFTNGSDGAIPQGTLILSGNTLYGTANQGGTNGFGAVFAVNTDGTGFTTLHNFSARSGNLTNSDGAYPTAGLILSGNTLFGTAEFGGVYGNGTVFAVSTNGAGFKNLHSFTVTAGFIFNTNSDGAHPQGSLVLSSNILYGTASDGGTNGYGTVFAVKTNGTGFTTLYTFTAKTVSSPYTNSDGAEPWAGLILSGNTLYGTAIAGGTHGNGTVFAVNTNGTGFRNLYSFSAGTPNAQNYVSNSDGAFPQAGLVLSGNTLYGTAKQGGTNGNGTVFAVNTDGTGFTTLHDLSNNDGAFPTAGLILSGNAIYGTATQGGTNGNGTVFALNLVPSLGITTVGSQVVLSWPAWALNFGLQTTTNLASPVWNSVSPALVSANEQNTVTNPIYGVQQFYRLIQYSPVTPDGMRVIPAGSFTMGDNVDAFENPGPPTNVMVSGFYMDVNLVTSNLWASVYVYATNHGYVFDSGDGQGKSANHPIQTVNWYDCVKWCNARSQQAGLTPVYYTNASLTKIYTNLDVDAVYVNWSANGYRLPTEAEWEKAARGGLSGQRFPWGNTISESQANYAPGSGLPWDLGGTQIYATGAQPYTSPVESFPANGYGLNDMIGNVSEWNWDWYADPPFPLGSPYLGGTDPHGPASSPSDWRVTRGGNWQNNGGSLACYNRSANNPVIAYTALGFRCVRGF